MEIREEKRCYSVGFEDGGRGHEPGEYGQLLEARKGKGVDSP